MPLSKFLQSALWSYDLKKIDRNLHKRVIITQILNHGTWEQLKWLLKNYTISEIKKEVENPRRGEWRPSVINYWIKILGIKASDEKIKKSLNKIYAR